jgi:FeS assembly SUF system protein
MEPRPDEPKDDAPPPAPRGGESEDGIVHGGDRPLRDAVAAALRTCYDPEIPVDIYELGLIYDISVDEAGRASIRMTLTSPACPAAEALPPEVEAKARAVPGVSSVALELVWEPPWTPERMSEAAKLELGMI